MQVPLVEGDKQQPPIEPTEDITTWVFEEGTFVPAAKIKGNKRYSIVTDYLGTPIQMYDEQGEKTWDCTLDVYGKVANFEGSSLEECPFRYQGQYEDKKTGLYYNRFRYYSAEEGMYISQDPIRLAGGLALYNYVGDTIFFLDALGWIAQCVKNKKEGLRREDTIGAILSETYGKKNVLRERILLDCDGNKITDANGKGRRVDYVTLDEKGKATRSIEVTSRTADKRKQEAKEQYIRAKGSTITNQTHPNGGVFVKDDNGNLIEVTNVQTKTIRIK